MEAINITITSH